MLGMGLAVTVLYTSAGPLVPTLHSCWIVIHVFAAIAAAGLFTVGATVLYLAVDRRERRLPRSDCDPPQRTGRLPAAAELDRLAYRTIAVAFPIWTFAIIAAAIWTENAWGRYWGWDPKETWAFITWVVYAAYLHARATAGWRGRRAAAICLLGFAAFLFNCFA